MNTNESYGALVARLSESSVKKHFDAYADVDWNHQDHRIAQDDPRFELGDDDPLGGTAWYRALPQSRRARIGLHFVASRMRTGIDFENVLSRGLLEFANTRPCGSPELRYAYHEVIEEGQHSLMFQELVHRTGLPVDGLTGFEAWGAKRVPELGRTFPECFFVHVLAGEAPIDHLQRRMLDGARTLHPLLRRIMQIHVIEEARHICFAEHYLDRHVPCLGAVRAFRLRAFVPFIVRATCLQMMRIPRDVVRAEAIPRVVVREAERSPQQRTLIEDSLRPIHRRMTELGILSKRTLPLWRFLGVGPSATTPLALA